MPRTRPLRLARVKRPSLKVLALDCKPGKKCVIPQDIYVKWRHNGGVNCLFLDGHVHWYEENYLKYNYIYQTREDESLFCIYEQ